MPKFTTDINDLDNLLNKKIFKLADVKDRIEKVGFDVVRFKDHDPLLSELWQIHHGDDGDYLVAMYEDKVKTASVPTTWETEMVENKLNIHYKGYPITRIAANQIGLTDKDLAAFASTLAKGLHKNASLKNKLLNLLPIQEKQALLKRFPELA